MSEARQRLDWEGMFRSAIDPVMARHLRRHSEDDSREVCTMCGELCAIRSYGEYAREQKTASPSGGGKK
jgi:phosphomethylpyrimidine synthase